MGNTQARCGCIIGLLVSMVWASSPSAPPRTRVRAAPISALPLFLLLFASTFVMERNSAASFTQPMDRRLYSR